MKLVYVAGPYRGPNTWAIERNIRRAEDVAATVWKSGHAALCPHANSRHMDGVTTDENFLAGTMVMLRRCDAVLLVEGWEASSGSREEVREAMRLGLPVMHAWGDESEVLRILSELEDGVGDSARQQDPFNARYWQGNMK